MPTPGCLLCPASEPPALLSVVLLARPQLHPFITPYTARPPTPLLPPPTTTTCSNTVAAQPSVYAGAARLATLAVSLGQPFNCSSPLPLRWMLPAAWQLQVVGVDGAGNKAAPQDADWTVAFVAGQQYTRFLDGPYGRQPKTNLTFTFAAFDSSGAQLPAPGGFECWLEATAGARGLGALSPVLTWRRAGEAQTATRAQQGVVAGRLCTAGRWVA